MFVISDYFCAVLFFDCFQGKDHCSLFSVLCVLEFSDPIKALVGQFARAVCCGGLTLTAP